MMNGSVDFNNRVEGCACMGAALAATSCLIAKGVGYPVAFNKLVAFSGLSAILSAGLTVFSTLVKETVDAVTGSRVHPCNPNRINDYVKSRIFPLLKVGIISNGIGFSLIFAHELYKMYTLPACPPGTIIISTACGPVVLKV